MQNVITQLSNITLVPVQPRIEPRDQVPEHLVTATTLSYTAKLLRHFHGKTLYIKKKKSELCSGEENKVGLYSHHLLKPQIRS